MPSNSPSNTPEPPPGLSADGLDLFTDVVEEHGASMTATGFAALVQAARLVSRADALDVAVGNNFTVPGSTGQMTAHPLIIESRLARTAAVTALKSAGLAAPAGSASAAGAALVAARYRK